MKYHQTSNPIDASRNALRKVRSLDCVTPTLSLTQHSFRYPASSIVPELKASRFSVQAQKYKLTPTLECEEFQDPCKVSSSSSVEVEESATSLSRSPFVSILSPSTSAVSLVGLVDSTDQDYTLLCSIYDSMRGHLRFSRLVNAFVFSLLILATMARYRKNDDALHSQRRFTSSSSSSNIDVGKNHRGLLGPAMIESVTEALSPILPFAGGVDLRRNEHWSFVTRWSNIFWMTSSHTDNNINPSSTEKEFQLHRSIASIPRGGGGLDISARQTPINILSNSEPFLSRSQIAEMTLSDIAIILNYAMESSKAGFDREKYFQPDGRGNALRKELIDVLHSLDEAAAKSRGFLLQKNFPHLSDSHSQQMMYGDIDALQFCAAIRIFAEWRLLRQVPEGYKGYAVGMSLGHKDIVQNLAKIENSVHEWLDLYFEAKDNIHSQAGDATAELDDDAFCCSLNDRISARQIHVPQSPTLRDLLQHEVKVDFHPNKKLPILKEKSAAMGLLWVRRQCHYQTSIFNNVLKIPSAFSSAVHAVSAAYSEVYGNLHGWAVQKIFSYSFQSAPDIHVIFRHMNPSLLNELLTKNHFHVDTKDDHQSSESMDKSSVDQERTIESADTHDPNVRVSSKGEIISDRKSREQNMFQNLGHELENIGRQLSTEIVKIGDHLGKEWEKLSYSLFGSSKTNGSELNTYEARGGAVLASSKGTGSSLSGDALEEYISMKMLSDAQDRIKLFLSVAQPLLLDLAGLFAELNMDDPTRV